MDRQMDDDDESSEHNSNKCKMGEDGSLGAISKNKTQKDAADNPTRASTNGKKTAEGRRPGTLAQQDSVRSDEGASRNPTAGSSRNPTTNTSRNPTADGSRSTSSLADKSMKDLL